MLPATRMTRPLATASSSNVRVFTAPGYERSDASHVDVTTMVRPMSRRSALLGLVALATVAIGCGSDDGATGRDTAGSSAGATPDATSSPTPSALRFSAPLVPPPGEQRSAELDAATFTGSPVAFWFWAPG